MPKRRDYDPALIDKAVLEVKSGVLTYRTAANKYGTPKSTIEFKLKNPGHRDSCGPPTILTAEEEQTLTRWILDLAKRGFPRKKEDILSSVQKFLSKNPRNNPFKNNKPGDGWLKAFLRRHPEVTERTSEGVTRASSCVSEKDIRKWFSEIELYLEEKGLKDVIKDPSRVYNGDETGFQICPKTGKVYAAKGSKNVYSIEQSSSKETITVIFSFSANGAICCPMIIYPYKRIPEKIATSVNPSWGIGRSDSGWMTAETFYEYIADVFYPHLLENNIQLPVILFVDGHKSHLTHELSILCNQLQIELIALYPNATRILQPADVSAFRPVKSAWHTCVREWYINNPGEILNKQSFAPLLQKVINKSIKPEILINGFKICGLFPFKADAVDYSKCLAKRTGNAEVEDNGTPVMTYTDFIKVVGSEKIKKFESIDKIAPEESNENFWDLYHLWRHFKIPTLTVVENEETQWQNDEREHFDQELENGCEDVVGCNILEIQTENEKKDAELLSIKHDEWDLVSTSESMSKRQIEGHWQSEDFNNSNILSNSKCASDRQIERDEQAGDCSNSNFISNSENTSKRLIEDRQTENVDNSKKIKVLSNYLIYPKLPQRKRKKQTERLPFAITSKKYQEMIENKRALQQKLEDEKKERKRRREEIKKEKNCKISKSRKSSLNTCHQCKNTIKGKSFLKCDECKENFHKKCVPRNHQIHVPDEEDDLYVCHICYKQESDSGEDEEDEQFEMFEAEFEEREKEKEIVEGEEAEKVEETEKMKETEKVKETETMEEIEKIEETEKVPLNLESEVDENTKGYEVDNSQLYGCASNEDEIDDLFEYYKAESKKNVIGTSTYLKKM